MENGSSDKASLNENDRDNKSTKIGSPGGPDRRNFAGLAQTEKDGGRKHHSRTKEDGKNDTASGPSSAKRNAQGRGQKNNGQADGWLGPAVVPLSEEALFVDPRGVLIAENPAVEVGDAEVLGFESRLDQAPGSFRPVVEDDRSIRDFVAGYGLSTRLERFIKMGDGDPVNSPLA